jgi:hypothetical protein
MNQHKQENPIEPSPEPDQTWIDWSKERFDSGLKSVREYLAPLTGEPARAAVEPCVAEAPAAPVQEAVSAPAGANSSWLLSPEALAIGAAGTVAYGAVRAIDNATRPHENRTIVEHNR